MAKTTGAKRIRIAMPEFVTAWEASGSIKEVADKTGLKPLSIQARSSKYRSLGIPLKTMPRAGGAKLQVTAALELLAKLRDKTVEEVTAQATK